MSDFLKKNFATTGIVECIYESGEYDVVIRLEGNSKRSYINHGLKQGLELQKVKSQLIGQQIKLKYLDYLTPIDPKNQMIHLLNV